MKATITISLLLFCLTGWGQDSITDKGYVNWAEYTPPKDTFVQQSKYIWYNEATWTYIDSLPAYNTMSLIVNLWDEYKQECWNDSTAYPCHRSGSPYMNLSYGYSTCYIHKDPTLEGFMEFIRRRGK